MIVGGGTGDPGRWRQIGERSLERLDSPRFAGRLLAVAILTYAVLILWLTRGASFTWEEITYVGESGGFEPSRILEPFGGHLIAVTRLLFETNLRLFGPEHLPFQLIVIALTATSAALLFTLVRRQVGPLAALAAAVVVLFLGTTPEVIHGWATMWVQATAAGLGALVALDRRSRGGDLLACALLVLAIASFSVGVAFAIGVGASVLAAHDRRRLWIPLIPLALFAAWWIWALQFDEGNQTIANALLSPVWALDSLAAGVAALTGVGIDLTGSSQPLTIAIDWGRIVVIAAVILAVVGIRRRGPSPLLWAGIVFLLSLWFAESLSYSSVPLTRRTPDLDRYAYPVAVGIVLVLAASFRSWRPNRAAMVVVVVVVAFALPVNLWMLRDRGTAIRTESDLAQARLSAIEIERAVIGSGPVPIYSDQGVIPTTVGKYLAAVDRFGSFGYTPAELAAAAPGVRAIADETLGAIVGPQLEPARGGSCGGGGPVELTGRTLLRSRTGGAVELRRFADTPSIAAGTLAPGQVAEIELPADPVAQPWVASIPAGDLESCEPRGKP